MMAEALARVERKSKGKLAEYRGTVARATNEKLELFQSIVLVLLDKTGFPMSGMRPGFYSRRGG